MPQGRHRSATDGVPSSSHGTDRGCGSSNPAACRATQIANAQVIHQHDNDVWPFCSHFTFIPIDERSFFEYAAPYASAVGSVARAAGDLTGNPSRLAASANPGICSP